MTIYKESQAILASKPTWYGHVCLVVGCTFKKVTTLAARSSHPIILLARFRWRYSTGLSSPWVALQILPNALRKQATHKPLLHEQQMACKVFDILPTSIISQMISAKMPGWWTLGSGNSTAPWYPWWPHGNASASSSARSAPSSASSYTCKWALEPPGMRHNLQ